MPLREAVEVVGRGRRGRTWPGRRNTSVSRGVQVKYTFTYANMFAQIIGLIYPLKRPCEDNYITFRFSAVYITPPPPAPDGTTF